MKCDEESRNKYSTQLREGSGGGGVGTRHALAYVTSREGERERDEKKKKTERERIGESNDRLVRCSKQRGVAFLK